MLGFVEVITLLLGLAGFGITPNPQAPTADQALQYAMPEADIVVHVDVAAVVPGNYKQLLALPNNPTIKQSPELVKGVRELVTVVEGARAKALAATGLDLSKDIRDATLFLQLVPGKDPNFVATVRGKLSLAVLDKIAAQAKQQPIRVGGGAMIEMGPNEPALAVTKDGVLLAGTPKLVRDRLADTWKMPARRPGSALVFAQDAINAKPVFSIAVALSPTARKELAAKMGPKKNFLTDLGARHKGFAMSFYADGIGWTWVDSTKAGLDQLAMMSEGLIELMRAAQIAPRGFAKLALGGLESYKGTDRRVDEIIRRKADILKIVDTYTGDGTFKVTVNKDPRALRLDVRATGKSLSEVVPAGLVGPGALFFLVVGTARKDPAMTAPPPVVTPARPTPVQPPKAPKKNN